MNALPDKSIGCHRTGFTKSCRECVVDHSCQLWMQVHGVNPNTGDPIDRWGCADAFMPLLTIENSLMQRQTGAAVESFRNEVVSAAERRLAINGNGGRLVRS